MSRRWIPRWLAGLFALLVLAWGLRATGIADGRDHGIIFPRPFAVAVDDLGWMQGHNSGALDSIGPYRLGIKRRMLASDYRPLVKIGQALGIRLLGAFIFAELDRDNLLRAYPTTTPAGQDWDNSENVGPEQLEIMALVREQAAYLELGLHGVGHEHWPQTGVRKRAEWYNLDEDRPWPLEILQGHVQAIKGILAQYGLSIQEGHSFPESFVPGASGIHWNPGGDVSTGALLRPEGVRFANTDFTYVPELDPPAGPNAGGIDHGLLVLNREEYGNIWYGMASLPTVPVEDQESGVIETHWANYLAQDEFLQSRVTEAWIAFLRSVQRQNGRYLAKNTEQLASQWLYQRYASVEEDRPGEVRIDNSAMPQDVYGHGLLGTLVLKVRLPAGQHVELAELDGRPVMVYHEDEGFGFLHLPRLEAREYLLHYTLGEAPPDVYVDHKGTYNVYAAGMEDGRLGLEFRSYGTQDVLIRGVSEPRGITTDNPDLRILGSRYLGEERLLVLSLQAHDVQGETGRISLDF